MTHVPTPEQMMMAAAELCPSRRFVAGRNASGLIVELAMNADDALAWAKELDVEISVGPCAYSDCPIHLDRHFHHRSGQ